MVLYFSGTGNSKYIAKRIAEAIRENTVDLNMKIKENDTSPLQTGRDVIYCDTDLCLAYSKNCIRVD